MQLKLGVAIEKKNEIRSFSTKKTIESVFQKSFCGEIL